MEPIPFFSLEAVHARIRPALMHAWDNMLLNGHFILHERVAAFEQAYAHYHGVAHAVGVGNGLDALYLALRAGGIGPGHEVLVPSHTCYATWLAVVRTGATPVPVEVDASLTINPHRVEEKVTHKTKAIVPVHLYGHPCQMDAIMAWATKYEWWVVEDNAQAQGASIHGIQTGAWGHANATSFYPTKNIGALGDGGAITTTHASVAEFVTHARNYGAARKDRHETEGINSRLDEWQAAVLLIKLRELDRLNAERRALAEVYFRLLQNVGDLVLPPKPTDQAQPVFHLFVIQTNVRDALRAHLQKHGIDTAVHYPTPIHRQPAMAHLGLAKGSLPMAERLAQTVLSLPLYPGLTVSQCERVAEAIRQFF
ncbi:MAG: DegT/DnrJ/EryC1/StrS family aminotransferase [Cyclobacteriaceae bacterium]|jgi:dTDP-4-amino-4,6-dideoxygalactose transaminase|nr:DegT/DnrJ/EryC1/StrS family aminotransferase [Cyclobacteriaceae bacterium]